MRFLEGRINNFLNERNEYDIHAVEYFFGDYHFMDGLGTYVKKTLFTAMVTYIQRENE